MSVKKYLFCFQPRLASLIIGIIGVTIWSIALLTSLAFVVVLNKQVQKERNSPNKTAEELQRRLFFDAPTYFIAYLLAIIALILALINTTLSALLIRGCFQHIKRYVLTWVVWNAFQIVCMTLVMTISAEYCGFVAEPALYSLIPMLVVYVYMWVYVLMCYKVFAAMDRSVAKSRRLLANNA